ncbi:MAG: M3 family oligoendopeptidase [Candidatus Bathyarchaeia archaeon]
MSDFMRWDLSQLVEESGPEWIPGRLKDMVDEADRLRRRYRGNIRGMDPRSLLEFIKEMEEFELRYEGVLMYCRLRYAADSTDQVAKRLNDAARTAGTRASQALAFIEVELSELISEYPEYSEHAILSEYSHYLERKLRGVPHILSEREEQLILTKDKNGIKAWSQLQSDWLSTRTFEIEVEGEKKTMPYGKIIALYESPDRELRRRANQVVYEDLGDDDILWSSAVRAVCGDHLQMCEWRDYPSPMTQSLIANDVKKEIIESLIKTIEENVDLYRRYLRLKAEIMGLPRLGNWDIVAPLPDAPEKEYSWRESRELVTRAYMGFDEQLGGWVDEMYERSHIDGEPRNGKRSGAFCSTWFSGKSAYMLQSFNGSMGDVYTQTHELGHAIHAYLGSRNQTPKNYEIGSCIAECGSTFGELLLTDLLLEEADSRAEKQAILAKVLDEFGMAAFQVSARVWFEMSMYDCINAGEFLDGETVTKLWVEARDRIYGEAVEWLPEMNWEWTMKVHYYIPNYRFYNYPYVFAQLFVFALYRLYKEQGDEFVPKLKNLLAAGSSKSPWQLGTEVGFDITEEDFWLKGVKQAEEFIDMLEETV